MEFKNAGLTRGWGESRNACWSDLVAALSDLTLDTTVTIGPHDGMSLGESMAEMLEHQRQHLSDLEGALAG